MPLPGPALGVGAWHWWGSPIWVPNVSMGPGLVPSVSARVAGARGPGDGCPQQVCFPGGGACFQCGSPMQGTHVCPQCVSLVWVLGPGVHAQSRYRPLVQISGPYMSPLQMPSPLCTPSVCAQPPVHVSDEGAKSLVHVPGVDGRPQCGWPVLVQVPGACGQSPVCPQCRCPTPGACPWYGCPVPCTCPQCGCPPCMSPVHVPGHGVLSLVWVPGPGVCPQCRCPVPGVCPQCGCPVPYVSPVPVPSPWCMSPVQMPSSLRVTGADAQSPTSPRCVCPVPCMSPVQTPSPLRVPSACARSSTCP